MRHSSIDTTLDAESPRHGKLFLLLLPGLINAGLIDTA